MRKKNLLWFGVKDDGDDLNEILKVINEGLMISCDPGDIEDVYRIGGKNNSFRPIFTEFRSLKHRRDVFAAKKNLVTTNPKIFVNEDLPPEELLRRKEWR